jgi:hypothetical protein
MRLSRWSSVWCFALAACSASTGQQDPEIGQDDPATDTGSNGSDSHPGTDGGSVTPVCGEPVNAGTIKASFQLAADAGAAVLAAGSDGSVVYTAANSFDVDANFQQTFREGVTKLDASGNVVFTYAYGTVAALDASGNVFVAGAFSAPRDFGTGVIAPNGNVDVFLVKLSATGDVLFATTIGECGGTGVQSIAVGRDGRIAISGSAMGTVVVDASGAALFRLAAYGNVAFDTQGRLVVGGVFRGTVDLGNGHRLSTTSLSDTDSFVVRYGVDGRYDTSVRIGDAPLPVDVPGYREVNEASIQALSGIAVGPNDEVALAGAYLLDIDLFGQVFTTPPSFPSGTMAGTFVAKLDADFNVAFADVGQGANASNPIGGLNVGFGSVLPGNTVAVDSQGSIIVSSQTTGNAFFPDSYGALTKYNADGTGKFFIDGGNTFLFAGYGLGVSVDGCDNILWSSFSSHPDFNNTGNTIQNTYITVVAP